MTQPPPRGWMRLQWRMHRLVWDLSGGRLGRTAIGMPVLELVTVGHKSGQERSILITYVETPDGPALAGTNAGASYEPAWIKNLRADPGAKTMRGGQWTDVTARFLEGDERSQVWARFLESDEGYENYQKMLDRLVPIVVLEAGGR